MEKYLKARLQEAGVRFGRTHDLAALLEQCLTAEPFWETMKPDLLRLAVYAVNVRYPGESADKTEAREAVRIARRLRGIFRQSLSLKKSGSKTPAATARRKRRYANK